MWQHDLPGQPDIVFDEERSGFPAYWLSRPGEETGISGNIFLEAERGMVARLRRHLILPTTRFPLVRGAALHAFQALPKDEVAFHSVTLTCKDGEIDDFVLVRPKAQCLCTDVANSELTWVRKGEFYATWKRFKALPDSCMGGRSIAREKLNRMMIVSDMFKTKLESLDPGGVAFTAAEDSRWGYAKWVR